MRTPRIAAACASLLCLLLLASCSSAPARSDTVNVKKVRAAQDLESGKTAYSQGRYELALQLFTRSLSQYTSIDDADGVVRSYNAIGKSYIALGSLDLAQEIFLRARERASSVGPSLRFETQTNLGELYLAMGDARTAQSTLLEALAMPASARSPAQTAVLHHDLGTAERDLGNSAKSLEYFGLSLQANLSGKFFEEAASDYYMIASVYSREGSYEEALRNANLALAYDKRIENSPGIGKDLHALGLITTKKGDTAAAFDYFQRSYLLFTSLGFKADTRKALTGLIGAADALGRTADADGYRAALADLGPS